IGQRKGLGLPGPAADGKPRYVTDIDPESGTVRVGSAEDLQVWEVRAERAIWTSGQAPEGPIECVAQVRAHGGTAPALAEAVDGGLVVRLREPLTGVAKGQAVVLYRPDDESGDEVLGSGTITGTARANESLGVAAGATAGWAPRRRARSCAAVWPPASDPGPAPIRARRRRPSWANCPSWRIWSSCPDVASAPT